MDDRPKNIVLEHLRAIRSDLGNLKEGQRLTNERLGAIEHHMAGFHVTVANHTDEIENLRSRLEYIEKRLEIRD